MDSQPPIVPVGRLESMENCPDSLTSQVKNLNMIDVELIVKDQLSQIMMLTSRVSTLESTMSQLEKVSVGPGPWERLSPILRNLP